MISLPKDIDEKIQKLPVIGFGDSEAFQQVLFSEDFTDIFDYYKINYLPDVLKVKPEIEQKISLYLSLTNQDESFVEQTDQILYKRPVPDIHTFLNDKFYMYYSNATLYPYWKEQLESIFAKGSPIRKVIFSGCIGSGKSTVARKVFVYVLYRLLCLRYPRATFNIDGDSTIANIIISMTLKQVYDTNLLPFVKLMESMPCFQHVMSARAFENFDLTNPRCPFPYYVEKSSGTVFFPDNIIITCGSGQNHFTGYNVVNSFCLTGDTKVVTNYGTKKIKNLEKFIEGRKVYTYSLNEQGELEQSQIIAAKQTNVVNELMRLWIDDDFYIECTPNHKIPIKNPNALDKTVEYIHGLAYKQAQYLTEEDDVYNFDLSYNHDTKSHYIVKTISKQKKIDVANSLSMKFKKIEKIKVDVTPVYNLTVDHPNHNFLISINNQTSIIVKNCDEINEKSCDDALALLNTLDNRFSSRFSGSDLVMQSVVSSARTTNSPIGEYVKRLPKEPSLLELKPCLWEVKPDPNFVGDGTTFPVLVGNGSIPSRIITNPGDLEAIEKGDFYIPAGCLKIDVPTVYRSKFELQLDQSIQDIAGISTYDNSLLFRDTSSLEDPLLVPELTIEANLKENTNIFDCLPIDQLFVKDSLKDEWRLKRYPTALRYCHFDLSSSGECDTGICVGHKEYTINNITQEKEVMYVVDFIIYVTAKNMTDLEAVQNFAMELVTKGHIPIHTISCDQFQSALVLNTWEQSKLFDKVEKVSVDIKLDPYLNAASLIESGKVKVGQCEKLKKELEALVIDKGKVTRTTQLKDGADVLCGFIYNAQMNYNDIPQNEYYTEIKIEKEIDYTKFIDTKQEQLIDL